MNFEEIVQRIISSKQDLTRDKILEMIEDKKKTAEGYFTDEVAARLVALELGVEVPWWEPFRPDVSIKDIISGLNNVTVMGRVTRVYPVKTFTRPNGTEGKVARLLIADKTGTLRVVLWDERTSLAESGEIERGQIIKVSHGYVREGRDGKLELHVGMRTEVQVSPPDAAESEYLSALSPKITKIQQLTSDMRDVDVLARVVHAGEVREFKRPSGETGQVSTLLIKDETGTISLNLWDEKTALSKQIRPGDIVWAEGAYTRERFRNLKLNIGRRGSLRLNPKLADTEKLPPYEETTIKISEIKEEGGPVTVKGTITATPNIREVVTARDEKVTVASFELADDTGKIRVSAWRKLAEVAKDLAAGTQIEIKNAYTKKGFTDQLELTTRSFTSIEVLSKRGHNHPKVVNKQ
jgi:replication factor A1